MAQAAEKIAPSWDGKVESLEALDRLKGEFSELVERFKNRLTFERRSWSEAYAQGRVSLVVYFNWPVERLGGRNLSLVVNQTLERFPL
jgi:hypothetical protein